MVKVRGIYTTKRNATALESWRGSLEAMSADELDALLTDDERARWFRAIAGRLPDDQVTVSEALAEEDLRDLLAQVLAETRASA